MMWECREPEDYCCSDGPFVYMAHSEDDELLSLRQSEEAESVLIKEFAGVFDGQGRELDMPMEWDSARVDLKKAHWVSSRDAEESSYASSELTTTPLPDSSSGKPRRYARQRRLLGLRSQDHTSRLESCCAPQEEALVTAGCKDEACRLSRTRRTGQRSRSRRKERGLSVVQSTTDQARRAGGSETRQMGGGGSGARAGITPDGDARV